MTKKLTPWRIIGHWTAGADGVSDMEDDHYQFIVERDGNVVTGDFTPEDNIPPLKPGKYAAHTGRCNSYAIGVSMDAMGNAQERPFSAGKYPITEVQVEAYVTLCAELCEAYDIPVTRERVLTHAEVQPTLGVAQNGKWDVTWLPGMDKPGDAVTIGDILRQRILAKMRGPSLCSKPSR